MSLDSTGTYIVALDSTCTLYRSADFGASFSTSAGSDDSSCSGSVSSDRNDRFYYYSTSTVVVSVDYGTTWTQISSLSSSVTYRIVFYDSSGYHGVALFNDNAGNSGLYYSSDRGASWTLSGLTSGPEYMSCAADSNTGQFVTVLAKNDFVYSSSDYGATWVTNYAQDTNSLWYQIVNDATGKYVLASTYGQLNSGDVALYSGVRYEYFEPSIAPSEAPSEAPTVSRGLVQWSTVSSLSGASYHVCISGSGSVAAVADYDVMLLGFCRSGNVIGMTQLIGNHVEDISDQGVAEGNRGLAYSR